MGGNTRVIAALDSASKDLAVDDIRGFQNLINASGQVTSVGQSAGMTVTVGSGVYSLVSFVADATNVSTAPMGVSGN